MTSFFQRSKLDPTAQEFTPRSVHAVTVAYSPIGKGTTAGHDPFSQTLTPIPVQQSSVTHPVVSLPHPVEAVRLQSTVKTSGGSADNEHTPTVSVTETDPQTTKADQDSKKRKVSYKIPRLTRRYESRSQPAGSCTATS